MVHVEHQGGKLQAILHTQDHGDHSPPHISAEGVILYQNNCYFVTFITINSSAIIVIIIVIIIIHTRFLSQPLLYCHDHQMCLTTSQRSPLHWDWICETLDKYLQASQSMFMLCLAKKKLILCYYLFRVWLHVFCGKALNLPVPFQWTVVSRGWDSWVVWGGR